MSSEKLRKKYSEYIQAISNIKFATNEYKNLPDNPETEEELFDAVCSIIDTSRELNLIISQSPTSIYVADTKGTTLRANQYFENMTGLEINDLLGRTTDSIEAEELFQPSVCSIALREGKRVILPQIVNGNKEFVVAGTPILDENGEVFRVITNALLNHDTQNISTYFRTVHDNKDDINQYSTLIAVSESMQNVIKLADIIKNTQSTILIEGETGVGKSLLARHIHHTSERNDHKMTEINCGAIPPALLESELFGYAGGAFTGADKKGKPGLIEISDGGTILLDEISELPIALQVKLLHFLQNKKITRVGGTEEISVNVRVIAATNKSLEKLVEEGKFREDLFYRLNVVPITIPPLRERKDDIMPAVNYFMDKYTALYNKHLPINEKCIEFFENNYWKGNLRELENCVERLVVTEGESGFGNYGEKAVIKETEDNVRSKSNKLGDLEETMIIETYEKYGSSYKVAEELGISQSSAYRKIKKYVKKT